MNQSVIDRAWGFTRAEYVEAYSRVKPRPLAEKVFAKVFDDLEKDPGSSIGGDNALFALLSRSPPIAGSVSSKSPDGLRASYRHSRKHQNRRVGTPISTTRSKTICSD